MHFYFLPVCIFLFLLFHINCQSAFFPSIEANDQPLLISHQFLPPLRKGQPYQFALHKRTFFTSRNSSSSSNDVFSSDDRLCVTTIPPLPPWIRFIPENQTLDSSLVPPNISIETLHIGFFSYFSKAKNDVCAWPPKDSSALLTLSFQHMRIPLLDYPAPTMQSSIIDLLQAIPHSQVHKGNPQYLFLPLSSLPLQVQLPSTMYISNAPPGMKNITYLILDQTTLKLPPWMTWNTERRIWRIAPVTQPLTLDLVLVVLDSDYQGGLHQPFSISWGLLPLLPTLPLNIRVNQPGVFIRINLTQALNISMQLFNLDLIDNPLFLKLDRDELQGIVTTSAEFQVKLSEKVNSTSSKNIPVSLRVPPYLSDCTQCENVTALVNGPRFTWKIPSRLFAAQSKASRFWYAYFPVPSWLDFDGNGTFSGIPTDDVPQFQIMVAQGDAFVTASVRVEKRAPRSDFLPTLLGILATVVVFVVLAVFLYTRPWKRTPRTSKSKGAVEVVSISHQVLFAYRGVPFQTMFRMSPGHIFAVCIQKSSMVPSHDPRPQTYLSPSPLARMSFPDLPFHLMENPSHRGQSYVHVPHQVWLRMEYDVQKGLGFIKGMPKPNDLGTWEVRVYNIQALDQLLWNVVIRVI